MKYLLLILLLPIACMSQPVHYETVIPSSYSDYEQPTYVYHRPGKRLIVVGHSWGGNYKTFQIEEHAKIWSGVLGGTMVHPDYQGKQAIAGGETVRQDLVDAKRWGKRNLNTNGNAFYQGGSGGGHAGLMLAGYKDKAFKAYGISIPITSLRAWYRQLGKGYGGVKRRIRTMCGGNPVTDSEARKACWKLSPLSILSPKTVTRPMIWQAGIADTLVPATHTLKGFNKLVGKRIFSKSTIKYVKRHKDLPNTVKRNYGNCSQGRIIFKKSVGNKHILIHSDGHSSCLEKTGEFFDGIE